MIMKNIKRCIQYCAAGFLVLLFIPACKPFSRVEVRTKPELYLPLGRTSVDIPKASHKNSEAIDISDVNDKLLDSFNTKNLHFESSNIPTTTPIGEIPVPITILFEGFKTVQFGDSSQLKLSFDKTGTLSYKIKEVIVKKQDGSDTGIRTPSTQPSVQAPGSVTLDISGKEIPNRVTLALKVEYTGGGGTIKVTPTFEGTIQKATGISIDPITVSLGNHDIDMKLGDAMQHAEIAKGMIDISMPPPKTWAGITFTPDIELTQGTGFHVKSKKNPIPINDQKLYNNVKMTLTGDAKVAFNDATYTKKDSINADITVNIEKFTSVTIKNKKTLTHTIEQPLSEHLKGDKDSKDIALKIRLKNGLPSGNSIHCKFSSKALTIKGALKEFPSTTDNPNPDPVTFTGKVPSTGKDVLDVTVEVLLPNYNMADDTYTLKDVKPGTPCDFTVEIWLKSQWVKVF